MRRPIELSDRPRVVRRARLRFDARTQQHLLLSPERALLLNRTAASIVLSCTGARSVSQICAEVCGSVQAATVTEDVLEFLEQLCARRLIELSEQL